MKQAVINTNDFLILNIPPYYFMAGIGMFFAFSLYLYLIASNGFSVNKNGAIAIVSFIGLITVAKLFGVLTKILTLIQEGNPVTIQSIASSGIVFYGGLTGFILTFLALQKAVFKKISVKIVNTMAVTLPFFHTFARIGCFFAGCCYGKETSSEFGILYIANGSAVAVNRIPVQLIEALINLLIFISLFTSYLKKQDKNLLTCYLLQYSICRFFLEFLRGDMSRGVFGIFSFSQIYSIFIILLIYKNRRKQI